MKIKIKSFNIPNFKSKQALADFYTPKRLEGGLFEFITIDSGTFKKGNEPEYAINGVFVFTKLPPIKEDFSKMLKPKRYNFENKNEN